MFSPPRVSVSAFLTLQAPSLPAQGSCNRATAQSHAKDTCAKVSMSLQLHRQHFQIFSSAVPCEPPLPVSVTSHRHVRPGRVGGNALRLGRRDGCCKCQSSGSILEGFLPGPAWIRSTAEAPLSPHTALLLRLRES